MTKASSKAVDCVLHLNSLLKGLTWDRARKSIAAIAAREAGREKYEGRKGVEIFSIQIVMVPWTYALVKIDSQNQAKETSSLG